MRSRKTVDSELKQMLSSTDLTQVGSYTIGKTIGQGSFGKVKLARHIFTGQVVAIKIIDKIHAPVVCQEVETLKKLRHPNIAKLHEVLTSETKIFLVFEYVEGGEFFDYISKYKKMDDKNIQTRKMFWQMADAIRYCHEKNYCHRDLKLENILLDKGLNIKVIDFGFTRNTDNDKLLDTFCGSPAYAAPEIIAATKYSGKSADVWSLGIIFFTMVSGYLPFDEDDEKEMHKKVLAMDFNIPSNLQSDTISLLKGMIVRDPDNRITLDSVLDHAWFDNLKSSDPGFTIRFSDAMNPNITDNPKLLKRLESIGVQTDKLLRSVKSQACDSLSSFWDFVSIKSKGSCQILNSSPEKVCDTKQSDLLSVITNSESMNLDFSSPPPSNDDYNKLNSSDFFSPSRKTSWGESLPASTLVGIRRNMREQNPMLDRTRSMSATASTAKGKKKPIIEEGDEDLLF